MNFKSALCRRRDVVYALAVMSLATAILIKPVFAAEWKIEPSVVMKALYNDNVRMQYDSDLQEDSSAYTLEPGVKFAGNELNLWDLSVDARGRMTRYQDVEDTDSDNVFYVFNGGRQTELTDWRVVASFERNSNFDTNYETQTPDSGLLLDDRTDRDTVTVSPTMLWSISEISQISLSLKSTDVAFDEVTNLIYKNYDLDSVQFVAFWVMAQNHQLGFTSSYEEYSSPEAFYSYDQTVLQFDYSYSISQSSDISISLGGRRVNSLVTDGQIIGCENPGEFEALGGCLLSPPVLADLRGEDDGIVTNLTYSSKSETVSQSLHAGRTVIPSSFASAQEQRSASYILSVNNTERLSTSLLLDASKTVTISGIDTIGDRERYRIEPSVTYKLSKNWSLGFVYQHIEQKLTRSDEDSVSNTLYVNLRLHWPRLTTSY